MFYIGYHIYNILDLFSCYHNIRLDKHIYHHLFLQHIQYILHRFHKQHICNHIYYIFLQMDSNLFCMDIYQFLLLICYILYKLICQYIPYMDNHKVDKLDFL